MRQRDVMFSDMQPSYRYMPLGNGKADVFIYSFIGEVVNEEDNSTSFLYDFNEFRVDMEEITEEMISADPLSYLDYSNEIPDISLEERVSAMEDAFMELIGGDY